MPKVSRAAVSRFGMGSRGHHGVPGSRVMVPPTPGIPRALPRNEPPPFSVSRPSRTRPVMCPHMCRDATRKRVHMPMEQPPHRQPLITATTCGVCKEILLPHMTETVRARSADRTRAGVARVERRRVRCAHAPVCVRVWVCREDGTCHTSGSAPFARRAPGLPAVAESKRFSVPNHKLHFTLS